MARRQTAAQRREHVLDAAIAEFAASGYHAASTTAIARRAGISQPYIYALYRNKQDLFLAAYRQVAERIRARLVAAAEGAGDPEAALQAMGDAYLGLIADRSDVLCQLQAYAAAGDPELRAAGTRRVPPRLRGRARGGRRVARGDRVLLRRRDLPGDRGRARDPASVWPGGDAPET